MTKTNSQSINLEVTQNYQDKEKLVEPNNLCVGLLGGIAFKMIFIKRIILNSILEWLFVVKIGPD